MYVFFCFLWSLIQQQIHAYKTTIHPCESPNEVANICDHDIYNLSCSGTVQCSFVVHNIIHASAPANQICLVAKCSGFLMFGIAYFDLKPNLACTIMIFHNYCAQCHQKCQHTHTNQYFLVNFLSLLSQRKVSGGRKMLVTNLVCVNFRKFMEHI